MGVAKMPKTVTAAVLALAFFGSYNTNRIVSICCHIILSKIIVAIMDILKGTFTATNKLANGCRKNAENSDRGCTCLGFLGCYNTNRFVSICCHILLGKIIVAIINILKGTFTATNILAKGLSQKWPKQ
jgi:hypothetical protein